MKKNFYRVTLVLALCASFSLSALASGKSKKVTFTEDIRVGETVVKKGSYKVTFDEQTNVLTINRDKEVVAKVSARAEDFRHKGERNISYRTDGAASSLSLQAVNMGGNFAIIGSANASTGSASADGHQ